MVENPDSTGRSKPQFSRSNSYRVKAKNPSHRTLGDIYRFSGRPGLQAKIFCQQGKFEDVMSEVLLVAEIYEKVSAPKEIEICETEMTSRL